jgi:hypothetical protein
LDEELLNFAPIAFIRATRGIPTKKGRAPVAKFLDVEVYTKAKGDVRVVFGPGAEFVTRKTSPAGLVLPGDWEHFNFSFSGNKKLTTHYLKVIARAIFKIVLELIHLGHGPNLSMSERFDEVRRIVLGHQGKFHGFLLLGENGNPTERVALSYRFHESSGHPTTWVYVDIYGLKMITEIELRDTSQLDGLPGTPGWTMLRF